MSQFPPPPSTPYQPTGFAPQPPKTNGLAIASLICGIIGCVPFVTSLAAIILGILGIKKAREPQTGGKGIAIAGLVLGILGLLLWIGICGVGVTASRWFPGLAGQFFKAPAQQVGTLFINHLASGDTASASNFTTPDFSAASLTALATELKSYGTFKSLSIADVGMDTKSPDGKLHINVTGNLVFDSSTKTFEATLTGDRQSGVAFKIENFKIR